MSPAGLLVLPGLWWGHHQVCSPGSMPSDLPFLLSAGNDFFSVGLHQREYVVSWLPCKRGHDRGNLRGVDRNKVFVFVAERLGG